MNYLVDANVLSEPTKPKPAAPVVRWLRDHESDVVVNPVILGELRFGILTLEAGRRRDRLDRWFRRGVESIVSLDWTRETGLRWAELLAHLRAEGNAMPVKDSLIAATALEHGLTIATRNVSDFRKAGVTLVNPFDAAV